MVFVLIFGWFGVVVLSCLASLFLLKGKELL